MKHPLNHLCSFIFSVTLLSITTIAVSCTFGVLPAFNPDSSKTQVSITLGSESPSTENGRAIIRGNGYLYIQTELTASNAVLHGPYQFTSGKTLTIADIPAGSYSSMLVIVTPDALPSSFTALVPSDTTAAAVRTALQSSLNASQNIISGTSFSIVPNITINEGTTNTVSTTLVPATALSPDASGKVTLNGKAGEVNRIFISYPNLKASFGATAASTSTILGCTVTNKATSAATVSAFGLYDSSGKQLSLDTTGTQLATGGTNPYTATWSGDDQLYLYIEFKGDSLQLNCTTSIKASTHTITYNANNGTGTTIVRTLIDGSTGPLEANTFTNTGYTFLGWTTITGSSTVQYGDGVSFTMPSSDVIFYAVWKANTTVVYRTISYDSNGGTGTMASKSLAEGTSVTLDANTFTRTGYTFLGWATSASSTVAQYASGATYTVGSTDMTFYAVWQAAVTITYHTLTYTANGGTGAMATRTVAEGAAITLDANTFTRPGYTFAGWGIGPGSQTVIYGNGASYTMGTTDVMLYAVWKIYHTISFVANGGTGTMSSLTVEEGQMVTLPINVFIRSGFIFLGWSLVPSSAIYDYSDGIAFTMGNSDLVLYAGWGSGTYTVSFDANGGTGTWPGIPALNGDIITLPANPFTRAGYTFMGWSTDSGATTATFTANMNYTVGAGNITFYAIWVDSTQPVVSSLSIASGAAYTSSMTPSLTLNGVNETGSGIKKIDISGDVLGFSDLSLTINGVSVPCTVTNMTITLDNAIMVTGTVQINNIMLTSTPNVSKSVYCTVTDVTGNISALSSSTIFLDTMVPNVTITSFVSSNASTGFAKPGDTLMMYGTVSDQSGIAGITATIASSPVTATITGATFTATYTVTSGENEGPVSVSVTATDSCGLSTTTITTPTAVIIDKSAPIILIDSFVSNSSYSSGYAAEGDTLTISGSVVGEAYGIANITATIAGSTAVVSMPGGSTTFTAIYTVMAGAPNGVVPLSVTVTDYCGLVSTITTAPSALVIDSSPPVISALRCDGTVRTNNSTVSGIIASPVIDITATDINGITKWQYMNTSDLIWYDSASSNIITLPVPGASTVYHFRVFDASGNVSTDFILTLAP